MEAGLLLLLFLFWRNEFQKITDLTIQNRTDAGKYIRIQTGNIIVAIVIDLASLHFCLVAQLILADTGFLDQFIQLDMDGSVLFHIDTPCRKLSSDTC